MSFALHVAIVMDGNGRWAQRRGLPRVAGHKRGAEAVRSVIEAAPSLGIRYLTLYGFSAENWRRPEAEVTALMNLLRVYLRRETESLREKGVRLRFIGDRTALSEDIVTLMASAEEVTSANDRLHLTIALNYGARQELTQAVKDLVQRAVQEGWDPSSLSEVDVSDALMTSSLPDPDLFIRTSGEQRLSNFLLWQLAYAELHVTDVLWPDFDATALTQALVDFQGRQRRFGGVQEEN
ncbi:MAG: isoprenyl transferase [Synechococcus sp.]|nr:isoprenyl transferase [Synechococcus sp.]